MDRDRLAREFADTFEEELAALFRDFVDGKPPPEPTPFPRPWPNGGCGSVLGHGQYCAGPRGMRCGNCEG